MIRYSKLLIVLAIALQLQNNLIAQNPDTLYSQNFDAGTILPSGWSATANWNISNASSSSSYTGASGANNIAGVNNSSVDTHHLIFSNELSTQGFTHISVIWGARRTSAFTNEIIFSWSKNGTEWDTLEFINTTNNSNWALVNEAVYILLPDEVNGVNDLHLRWSFDGSLTSSGNYRMDDLIVTGIPDTTKEDFEIATKSQYSRDTIQLRSGKWILDNALTGATSSDLKNGTQSLRIRGLGVAEMYFDVSNGIDSFYINHGKFGTDANSEWKLQFSNNCGIHWEDAGNSIQSLETNFVQAGIGIKKPGRLRIRIVKTSSSSDMNRINFDDLLMTPYVSGSGPEIFHDSLPHTHSTDDRIIKAFIGGDGLFSSSNVSARPVLWYRVNENNWQYVYYNEKNCSEFIFILPAQLQSSFVEYYLAAEDKNGITTLPAGGSGNASDTIPPAFNPPSSVFSFYIYGYKYWTGSAGTANWNDYNNWATTGPPQFGDTVVLDNSMDTSNYSIELPSGTESVSLAKIRIIPASGKTISLRLPSANTNSNALILNSDGVALLIDSGGVFINSSGASSGTGIHMPKGKLKINDHGKYVHNTLRAHSTIVDLLSTTPGTEFGIFELNIPGSAGTSIASSGKTFGSLHIKGSRQYTNSGSNVLIIRGDLFIESGSVFYPALNANIHLKGNLEVNGNLEPNLTTGTQLWKFNGNNEQLIKGNGNIIFNEKVNLEIDNPKGIKLEKDLSLDAELILKSGNFKTDIYTLYFEQNAVDPAESSDSRIVGHSLMSDRNVNTDSLKFIGVEIGSGTDDIGKVIIERFTGNEGIIEVNGKESIACYWKINSDNQPVSGRNLKFQWLSDLDNSKNMAQAEIWQKPDTNWIQTGSTEDISASNPRIISLNTTSFSDWTISDNNSPLPVELLSFEAFLTGEGIIQLNWVTASELNNLGFEILRKMDDQIWISIGFISGNGTSFIKTEYNYDDYFKVSNPAKNLYYRLKQIDYNGRYSNSDIIFVNLTSFKKLNIYPNPVKDVLYIIPDFAMREKKTHLKLVDINGITIFEKEVKSSDQLIKIDLEFIENGIYFLIFKNSDQFYHKKIVKIQGY